MSCNRSIDNDADTLCEMFLDLQAEEVTKHQLQIQWKVLLYLRNWSIEYQEDMIDKARRFGFPEMEESHGEEATAASQD